jgi:hypothetical protein
VRAQIGEETALRRQPAPAQTRRRALALPAPEQFGIVAARESAATAIDWAAVHSRLDHLGVTCFHLEKRTAGDYRVTCLLPAREQGKAHRIEAAAASEPEAIRLTLTQAEAWAKGP